MKITLRQDSVEIEGYVNAIERNSKTLKDRVGEFIERICKGAFKKALKRNDDVHILLNHNWDRDLGSTKKGNLELEEDNIGLRAKATIYDDEVINKARNGDLVGWSFGFEDVDVERTLEHGVPYRAVKDLNLYEVSILDRTRTPAYDGTLIMARSDDKLINLAEDFEDECIENNADLTNREKPKDEPKQQEQVVEKKEIDYSKYEKMIEEMKGEK